MSFVKSFPLNFSSTSAPETGISSHGWPLNRFGNLACLEYLVGYRRLGTKQQDNNIIEQLAVSGNKCLYEVNLYKLLQFEGAEKFPEVVLQHPIGRNKILSAPRNHLAELLGEH